MSLEHIDLERFTDEQVAEIRAAAVRYADGTADLMTDFTPSQLAYQFTVANIRARLPDHHRDPAITDGIISDLGAVAESDQSADGGEGR